MARHATGAVDLAGGRGSHRWRSHVAAHRVTLRRKRGSWPRSPRPWIWHKDNQTARLTGTHFVGQILRRGEKVLPERQRISTSTSSERFGVTLVTTQRVIAPSIGPPSAQVRAGLEALLQASEASAEASDMPGTGTAPSVLSARLATAGEQPRQTAYCSNSGATAVQEGAVSRVRERHCLWRSPHPARRPYALRSPKATRRR